MPYDRQGRWIEENEWQQMMREQAARRVGAFSRYDTPAPSVYPNQAAPYGSFGATPSVGPYPTSPFMRRREAPATVPFDTSEPAPMYGPGSDPRRAWKFNNDPIAINQAFSKPSFTEPLNVLNQQATGNFQGETLAGPTVNQFRPTGSDYTPQQLSTPIDQLEQQNIPSNVVPLFDPTAGLAASDPNLQGDTPFSMVNATGNLAGYAASPVVDNVVSPAPYFGGEQGGHGGFELSDSPGLFPWGPGTDPVTADQTSNTGFRPGFGTLRDSYAPQPEDDAGDDFFGDGDVSGAQVGGIPSGRTFGVGQGSAYGSNLGDYMSTLDKINRLGNTGLLDTPSDFTSPISWDHPYMSSEDATYSQALKSQMADDMFGTPGRVAYGAVQPVQEVIRNALGMQFAPSDDPTDYRSQAVSGYPTGVPGTVAQVATGWADVQPGVRELVDDLIEENVLGITTPDVTPTTFDSSALASPTITAQDQVSYQSPVDINAAMAMSNVSGLFPGISKALGPQIAPGGKTVTSLANLAKSLTPIGLATGLGTTALTAILEKADDEATAADIEEATQVDTFASGGQRPAPSARRAGGAQAAADKAAKDEQARQASIAAAAASAKASQRAVAKANAAANKERKAAARRAAAAQRALDNSRAAAAKAAAASAAQAQAAQANARALLADAASRDRGGPSSREIAAAIEVMSQVDTFDSGGRDDGGFNPQGGTTGSSGMGNWT